MFGRLAGSHSSHTFATLLATLLETTLLPSHHIQPPPPSFFLCILPQIPPVILLHFPCKQLVLFPPSFSLYISFSPFFLYYFLKSLVGLSRQSATVLCTSIVSGTFHSSWGSLEGGQKTYFCLPLPLPCAPILVLSSFFIPKLVCFFHLLCSSWYVLYKVYLQYIYSVFARCLYCTVHLETKRI